MTFILKLDLAILKMYIRIPNTNLLGQGFQTLERYKHADTQAPNVSISLLPFTTADFAAGKMEITLQLITDDMVSSISIKRR